MSSVKFKFYTKFRFGLRFVIKQLGLYTEVRDVLPDFMTRFFPLAIKMPKIYSHCFEFFLMCSTKTGFLNCVVPCSGLEAWET